MEPKILSLRMERQCLVKHADEQEYLRLYRDMQPGLNVYWNGFGQPPTLSFRASFDDIELNRRRQAERALIKGRFAGGNPGWIVPEDLELFAALYRKKRDLSFAEKTLYGLIEREGPLTIQQLKEESGMLVKEITPALHRLQEAFLLYEDQYDGEWDRSWYRFEEVFPDADLGKYTRQEALKTLLKRFAFRLALFDEGMARAFYRLPEKEVKAAAEALIEEGAFVRAQGGYMLSGDAELMKTYEGTPLRFVRAVHRNDVLYRADEPALKRMAARWLAQTPQSAPYDREPLQYLLIDGEFHGACVGHFRNGPYDLNDVVCDLKDAPARKAEILAAIAEVNFGKTPARFMGA